MIVQAGVIMNIDGITLQCITKELQKELTGGQITKIYQPRARTLYFRIFSATGLHHVIITCLLYTSDAADE